VGGDPGEVHAAAVVFGVDVGEVDREDGVGLRGEELSPGRSGPSWRRSEARAF
jgi:hypothetical protein